MVNRQCGREGYVSHLLYQSILLDNIIYPPLCKGGRGREGDRETGRGREGERRKRGKRDKREGGEGGIAREGGRHSKREGGRERREDIDREG